jgi:phosphoglycerate dehydrogenase-like enzyme
MLSGGVCGILGFGRATARVMRALGMGIWAINRNGATDVPVDWTAPWCDSTISWAAADALVICTPLTPATERLIDAAALARVKKDAILANLARGEIHSCRRVFVGQRPYNLIRLDERFA